MDVVLEAHARDHLELRLEGVDMLLFVREDFAGEVAS